MTSQSVSLLAGTSGCRRSVTSEVSVCRRLPTTGLQFSPSTTRCHCFQCRPKTSQTNLLEKCLFFLLPSMSNSFHQLAAYRNQPNCTNHLISLQVMTWSGRTPQEHHLAGDDVMHCFCRGYYWGFHIKLHNSLSCILSLCALSKKTKKNSSVSIYKS